MLRPSVLAYRRTAAKPVGPTVSPESCGPTSPLISARVTLVLFRRRARDELVGPEQKIGARVRKSRQKEAAGAAGAGPMQIEWSEGEVLKLTGVGTEVEEGVHERVRARIICEPRTKGSVFPSWLLMRRMRLRSDHCPALWWGNRGSFF